MRLNVLCFNLAKRFTTADGRQRKVAFRMHQANGAKLGTRLSDGSLAASISDGKLLEARSVAKRRVLYLYQGSISRVPGYHAPKPVEGDIAARLKFLTPIIQRLLVYMHFAALPWYGGRKHYHLTVATQIVDENIRFCPLYVFCNLQRLDNVECTAEVEWHRKIERAKSVARNRKIQVLVVIAIQSNAIWCAHSDPFGYPNAASAPDVYDALRLQMP